MPYRKTSYGFGAKAKAFASRAGGKAAYVARVAGGRKAVVMGRRAGYFPTPLPTLATRGWVNNNTELKYNDIASASYQADTTGTVTALNLTAVGDDNTTRDGRQIINKSVHVQGILSPEDRTTNTNLARMLLVWDSQPNSGTIAAITDILTAATSVAPTNLNNRERFRILRDCRYACGINDNTATQAFSNGNNTYMINEYVKLGGVKTTYSGTTAAIGSVATGALLMVTIGNQAAGAAGTFIVTTRLRFTDH